jgi:phosphate-selective porin
MILCAGLSVSKSLLAASADYKWPGVHLKSSKFTADIKLRAQLRITSTDPYDSGFDQADETTEASINRSRIKIGGQFGVSWIDYYSEYDFPSNRLLDLRFTFSSPGNKANVRVGQWKVPFNRERIDSSGKQQFVDRSIANKWFTLDRQRGVSLFGRLAPGSRKDSWYHLAILEGAGRNGEGSAESPMWLGRWEWNFLGRDVGFSQSDTGKREVPAGSVSIGATGYRGPYSSFSSAGGGQLPGFESGGKDRYKVRQYMFESAYQYAGFSWQQEFHYKNVDDTQRHVTTSIQGGYLQSGYFPHGHFDWFPPPLEFAFRYATVDPDTDVSDDRQTEIGFVANWFFSGHNSKMSLDINRLWDDKSDTGKFKQTVVRLQWDFHI